MSIVLFALIGAAIDAKLAYWICFGVYCMLKATIVMSKFLKVVSDKEDT